MLTPHPQPRQAGRQLKCFSTLLQAKLFEQGKTIIKIHTGVYLFQRGI